MEIRRLRADPRDVGSIEHKIRDLFSSVDAASIEKAIRDLHERSARTMMLT